MQTRSESDSLEAKAQHEPQRAWSRIAPMQPGHLVRASKLAGTCSDQYTHEYTIVPRLRIRTTI